MDKERLLKLKNTIKLEFEKQNELSLSDFINLNCYEIIKKSGLFDAEYYFSKYPDVKLAGFDPITHYINFGVQENCNPNEDFNTKKYLDTYPDVNNNPINPFVHYILYGIFENRSAGNNLPLRKLEQKYKVSIIMPTFNRENIISNAIYSVINQSFKNFELIIIDDGSTDGTERFIKDKFSQYFEINKIRYFKLNHQGVSAARNVGLKNSDGNIIAYLDSDNQWNSEFLSIMIAKLDESESDSAYCGVMVNNRVTNKDYVLNQAFNRKQLLDNNFIDLNSFIHKKRLYELKGGFDEKLTRLVDWDLIIRYTDKNPPIHVNDVLVNYIIDSNFNNITTTVPLDRNMQRIRHKYWAEIYEDEYEAIRDIFDTEYYFNEYPDVLESGLHPLYHFLEIGSDEGRNPNKEFVTSFYKNKYPDVVRNKLNPFVHYAKWGEQENREINYFSKKNSILENNLIFLSNYEFDEEPLVSIVILTRNGLNHLKVLFEDFSKKTNYSNFEIIVVDNDSSDKSVEFLKSLTDLDIKIIENKENVSFSKGNNDAVKIANGEYVLLINNDVEPTYGWLNELMGTIIYGNNVGVVGAKLLYPYIKESHNQKYSFTIQHAGDIFRETINNGCLYEAHNQNKYLEDVFDSSISVNRKCLLVTGAVLLTKKEIYDELNGLDERFWYGYEDIDFNLKVYQKGYAVIFASAALLFHHESATPKKPRYLNNHKTLCEKWGKFLFKELLRDKIEKNYFFTDKKLNFLFVANHNFMENKQLRNSIHRLTSYLNKQDYQTSINLNITNLKIDSKVDVILSFTSDYDIENITARKNVIKILVLSDDSVNLQHDYSKWDLVITDKLDLIDKFRVNYENKLKVYYQEDFSELGTNLISILERNFLKNDEV